MMKRALRDIGVLMTLLAVGAVPAYAGGLYLYELSASDVGLGSAGWTARAHDASTLFKNPAGMVRIDDGDLLVNVQGLYLDIQFSPDPATTTSGSDGDASGFLPTPGIYYVLGISDDIKFGIGMAGYFGLAASYEDDWVGRYYVQNTQLQAVSIQPTAAFRLGAGWSLGVGIAAQYGIMDTEIAINNVAPSAADGQLSLDDTAWGYQGNLGVLWEGKKGCRVGLQYLSAAKLDFSAVPDFTNLAPALQSALAARGLLDARLDLGMKMPRAVRVGWAGVPTENWDVFADLGWEDWSQFGKVDVGITSTTDSSLTTDLQYEDVWHVAAGARRQFGDAWGLNFGVAYDSSMVDDANRTLTLPVGPATRFGIGGEWSYGKGEVAFGYELIWSGDLPVDVNRGPLAGRVSGSYDGMAVHAFAASWRKVF